MLPKPPWSRTAPYHPYGLGDDYADYRHPDSIDAVVALVEEARRTGSRLRVRGSGHSARGARFGTDDAPTMRVMLDRLADVRFLRRGADGARVRVLAGCSLGGDPHAPAPPPGTPVSRPLIEILDEAGYALPVLGGITHQTLGGFMATGSQGASCTHAFDRCVVAVELVDGRGLLRRFERDDPHFHAVGASLGLLGVVVAVELDVVRRFGIRGRVSTQTEEHAEIDLFGHGAPGRPSLADFLDQQEYARLMWWPQRDLRMVEVWQGQRSADPPTEEEHRPNSELVLRPELQRIVRRMYLSLFPSIPLDAEVSPQQALRWKHRVAQAIRLFIRESPRCAVGPAEPGFVGDVRYEAERFHDTWYGGMAMDNPMHDDLMPVQFTELWVPLDRTAAVMRRLRDYYEGRLGGPVHELDRTGTFAVEIYGAAASPGWIVANHGTKVVRIDPFRFDDGDHEAKMAFFRGIWDALAPLGFRPHWGKTLSAPDGRSGVAHRRRQLPKLDAFLELRAAFDPDGLFAHDYWMRHLGFTV